MSRSDRQKRRALGFEDLEGKTSPTSLIPIPAIGDTSDKAVIVSSAGTEESAQREEQAVRFLSFVSSLENVSIERGLPSQAEASAVDGWIVCHMPPTSPSGLT